MRLSARSIAALAAGVSISLVACSKTVPYVAIPEEHFRSEATRQDRLKLPLDEQGRARLVAFLRAGGDKANVGSGAVDPGAEQRYAPLLARLSDSGALALEDLTERKTYDEWFSGRRLRQVVDAREDAPPAIEPVAATDGTYWWIFYPRHKRLAELLVVRAIPQDEPR